MTQAGRQGSPRNSSGRNSSGTQFSTGRRRRGASARRRSGAADSAALRQAQRRLRRRRPPLQGTQAARGALRRSRRGTRSARQAAAPSDWKPGRQPSARKPAARKPGAKKAPGTPGALKPKPRTGKPGAAASRAFGSERFGQNLGPVRKPSRKRGPRGDVPQSELHDADGIRLQKVMAQAGVASRRVCEEMIAEGRVEVDGQVVTELGVRVDPKTAVIHVDGLRIQLDENLVYMVFNKPKGVVSTMEDPDGRPCISDFVRNTHRANACSTWAAWTSPPRACCC